MSSSQTDQLQTAYPKAVSDCKHEMQLWPVGEDTPAEAELIRAVGEKGLIDDSAKLLQQLVYSYYAEHRRDLPWRDGADPYRVLVSEIMLQQTQVDRVIPKFTAFMQQFPDARSLADAPLADLLAAWQGLGYNRRALSLQRAARMLVDEWGGSIPDDPVLLQQLPGIGPYTAGAVASFAFNRPQIFLETNIRAVLLHFFFADQEGITDTQLLPVAEAVLDQANPRDWYNALMDYGSDLKRRFPNPSRRSRHHNQQSRFEGSDRQVRGAVLRLLLNTGGAMLPMLQKQLEVDRERLTRILEGMVKEGFLKKQGKKFIIPST
ncbi:MAG: A/G-specific adenine glycosylase [Trichlorobacter sp.]|uniref:A/G-specific adenine glycosylase n=1 Tax=Trichlorobacter sp. TaxID=2911007 RepID=UPI00256E55E7|nr:A/G-specific adenine glycosylase [Trichlorobacter sp.]MDK9717104.1 A/G-specific adenine glycosylase [Trichlorobacter sp.]